MPPSDLDLPTPPQEIPKYIREPLQKQPPSRLRLIAQHAEKLANAKEQQRKLESEDEPKEEEDSEKPERTDENMDLPDDVPAKASITTKEINDNHYYYWQWREGDKIKSKYKGPVNPD